jgi:hypothetical protein
LVFKNWSGLLSSSRLILENHHFEFSKVPQFHGYWDDPPVFVNSSCNRRFQFSHGLAVLRPVKRMQNPRLPAFAALAVKPRLQAWELDGKIAMAAGRVRFGMFHHC